jgi:ATP-dependent Lon protease
MRGDTTAALLDILDTEQNSKYRDYYLNFNIDLSKSIFIATANYVIRIPSPLRDRL